MPRKRETSSDVRRKIETAQSGIIQSYDSLQNAQDLYNSYQIRKQQETHQAFKDWKKLLNLQLRYRSLVNAERIAAQGELNDESSEETSEQAASGVEENNTSEGEPSSRALDEAAGNLSPAFDSLRLADNDDGEGDIQMIALGTEVNNLAEMNGMSSGSNRESIAIRERELGLDEDASADELSVVEENVICNQCQNCRRKQYTASGLYYMTFVQVQSNQISSRFYRNKDVPVSNSENTAVPLNLCNECWVHLRKDQPVNQDDMQLEDDREGVEAAVGEGTTSASNTKTDEKQSSFKYTAFAFLWDLLSGYCKSNTIESYHFYDVYGETLWQIIPRSMRPWWIDEIKVINSSGEYPYRNCTLDYPPCIFNDLTEAFVMFEKDISHSLPSMADALNRPEITDQIVLCPFGCSESCRNSHPIDWTLMIQCILKKVVLNIPSELAKRYRFYMHASDNYYRPNDDYSRLLMHDDKKVRPAVILTKTGEFVALACPSHKTPVDKLYLYPPRNPNNFNVNARDCDQIGPIQLKPRVSRQAVSSAYGAGTRMTTQQFDFKGIDSFSITQTPSIRNTTILQSIHGAAALAGRKDIRAHVNAMAQSGVIPSTYVQQLHQLSEDMYPNGIDSLTDSIQGATYIPFDITMRHHLSQQQQNLVNLRRVEEGIPIETSMKRNWPKLICAIQKEDANGFGYQFRAIPSFAKGNTSITWIMFGLVSSVSELWSLIDATQYFQKEQWPGHLLTNIAYHCFQHDTVTVSKKSPFKKTNVTVTAKTINDCCGIDDAFESVDGVTDELLDSIFSLYGDAIKVFGLSPDEEPIFSGMGDGLPEETKFLLFVTRDSAVYNNIDIDENIYEHRVLLCLKAKGNTGRGYDSVRFVRYGGKFSSYWMQHRSDHYTSQYRHGSDLNWLPISEGWCFVSLFVKKEPDTKLDSYRLEFLKSLGGQTHVLCNCCKFPLIPTHVPKEAKLNCNAWTGPPTPYEGCTRKESFICSNQHCNVRCCMKCFKEKPRTDNTMLFPHEESNNAMAGNANIGNGNDEDEDDGNGRISDDPAVEDIVEEFDGPDEFFNESDANDELIQGLVGPNDWMHDDDPLYIHTQQCPHLVHPEHDESFESNDDINLNERVPTTNAGDFPVSIDQREGTGAVGGYVLLNHVAGILNRKNSRVNGTQRERNFIQRLCSTTGGQSLSLLYPESSIFVRHFYSSATADGVTPIGGIPVILFREKSPLGLAPIEDHLRARITNQSSTISSDPNYTCFTYDVSMNQALGTSDSRILSVRGLRVNESGTRLSPREEDNNDNVFDHRMQGDVDSHKQVRNLCASMKYVFWSHFYTLTLSHKTHPGIKDLFEWKQGQEWLKYHPEYPNLSPTTAAEFVKSFEDAYAHVVTPKWLDVVEVLLNAIKTQLTHIGAVTTIFSRHEYQETAGNVSHIHMILAVDQSSMENDDIKAYLNELIAGHVMEIVPPEDIEKWKEEGFINDEYDGMRLEQLAQIILSHHCSPRCQRRVNSKGDESDTKCRKLHSVKDTPNPTEDCYVTIEYDWGMTSKELLEKINLYNSTTEEYAHSWFTPSRHMTACQPNATCNMSPVDRKLFAVLQSMQNLQYLRHTNGVCKYVVKYLVKIDKGNRITLHVNPRTGGIEAGKEFLHNTKIASSQLNEDKWFKKQRHSKHPTGVEIALTQIIHKVLLRNEVYTNLTFIDVNTQSFECRPQTRHELDTRTRRNNRNEDDAGDIADRQDSLVPTERIRESLHEAYHVTDGQRITFSEKKSKKFDKVSEFSLREPRLLKVANTLEIFYRCFFVGKTILNEADIDKEWSDNQMKDRWVDCLRRVTRLRMSALDMLKQHVLSNIEMYEGDDAAIAANQIVLNIIDLVEADNSTLTPDEVLQKKIVIDTFIKDDSGSLPPVPVFSNMTPSNPKEFIIHLLLTLGVYDTEKDLLLKPSLRECFRAANLVGLDDDEDSLLQDTGRILRRYIMEQLIFSPFPLSKAEYYMHIANQVINDAIISNGISMNEMPPVTMVALSQKYDAEESSMWNKNRERVLDCILYLVQAEGGPSKEEVMACTRENPIDWSPYDIMEQSPQQSEESFEEQKFAVGVVMEQLRIYLDPEASLQSRNPIVHGCPGAGKSFISLYCALFALSQGMNVVTTSLVGITAARIGGIHYHNLLCLDPNQNTAAPGRQAELALTRIERNKLLVYKLTTMDVLFIDEFYQFSAEQLSVIDIILRKIRNSNLPFGGVFILANMDHAQGGAINATPLLMSSFMLTNFVLVELKRSVRAHRDPIFQRLQQIARMSPLTLRENPDLVNEFRRIASDNFTFVDSWNDSRITPNMLRVFSKRLPTTAAIAQSTRQMIEYFQGTDKNYKIIRSLDRQRVPGSQEWSDANEQSKKSLNKKLKEVETIVLFKGARFEITMNDISHGGEPQYYQSQLAIIVDVPTDETINRRLSIPVLIPPPSAESEIDFDNEDECPTQQELVQRGWRRVSIPIASNHNRVLQVMGGLEAKREQYALRPVGASTISKCQGQTLSSGIAVEMTRENAPWEESQVIVATSRSEVAEKTVIVGDKRFALDLMCSLIQKPTQYTKLIDDMVSMLSINSDRDVQQPVYGLNLRDSFPFRSAHYTIPPNSAGFCYILYSCKDKRVTYTGETENLSNRLLQHNNGTGSQGTAPAALRPWALGGFIVSPLFSEKTNRLSVERKWRDSIRRLGLSNVPTMQRIMLIEEIVNELNQGGGEDFRYVITVENDESSSSSSSNNNSSTHFTNTGDGEDELITPYDIFATGMM